MSHLTRGAWIEIHLVISLASLTARRTSHEVRGLKSTLKSSTSLGISCRTSHEVRGLKFFKRGMLPKWYKSHLTRGAWIEILELVPGSP